MPLFLLLAGSLLFVSGCTPKSHQKLDKTAQAREAGKSDNNLAVYFASACGYMVPVSYPFDDLSGDPVRTAVELLLEGPRSDDLFRTIPKGTRLKDCYISDDTAFLDFSEEFYQLSNTKDTANAVKSLCLTMGSIPGVEKVQVLVEGQLPSEIHGVSMGTILEHGWVNYSGSEGEGSKYIVYFGDCSSQYMVPITYLTESSESIPRAAVAKLVEGPGVGYLKPTVNNGTKLLGFKIKDGIAYVDLSGEVTEYGKDNAAEDRLVNSLLLTLGQFSDIKGVQMTIEGKIAEYLPGGTQIGRPLQPIPITKANPVKET